MGEAKEIKPSGVKLSTNKISTYKGGEKGQRNVSNIYVDPNSGNTIATKQARENIADGGDYNKIASTSAPAGIGGAVDTSIKTGSVMEQSKRMYGRVVGGEKDTQEKILVDTYNPRPSKDLLTGEPLIYKDRTSTTSQASPALRRLLLGGGGSAIRRMFGL